MGENGGEILHVQKWIRLFKKHQHSIVRLDESSHVKKGIEQSKICYLNIIAAEPNWPALQGVTTHELVQGLETKSEYSISMTFFHARHIAFYGSTYTGRQYSEERGELKMNENVYWHSNHIDPDCYLVIELVSTKYCVKSGTILEYGSCGWSLVHLDSIGGVLTAPIYRGSPRKLLYLNNGGIAGLRLEADRTDSSLHYSLSSNDLQIQESPLVENHIMNIQQKIPGIIFDEESCSIQTKDLIGLKLRDVVVACKSMEYLENDLLTALPGLERERGLEDRKVTFLNRKRKKKGKKPRITRRRMKLGVSNSYKILWSTEVNMSVGDDDKLYHQETIEVKKFFMHHLCALICALEYQVCLPSTGSSTKDEILIITAGYQVFLPFSFHSMKTKEGEGKDETSRGIVLPLNREESCDIFWSPTHRPSQKPCLDNDSLEVSFNMIISSDVDELVKGIHCEENIDIGNSGQNPEDIVTGSTEERRLNNIHDDSREKRMIRPTKEESKHGIPIEREEEKNSGDDGHQENSPKIERFVKDFIFPEQKVDVNFEERGCDEKVKRLEMKMLPGQNMEGGIGDREYKEEVRGKGLRMEMVKPLLSEQKTEDCVKHLEVECKETGQTSSREKVTLAETLPSRNKDVERIVSPSLCIDERKPSIGRTESEKTPTKLSNSTLVETSIKDGTCSLHKDNFDPSSDHEISNSRHGDAQDISRNDKMSGGENRCSMDHNGDHVPLLITSHEKLRSFIKDAQAADTQAQYQDSRCSYGYNDEANVVLQMFNFTPSREDMSSPLSAGTRTIPRENAIPFFLDLLKDYNGHFRQQVLESIIVDWYKQKSKRSFIQGCIKKQIEQR